MEPTSRVIGIELAGFPDPPNVTRRGNWHANSDEAATWRNSARLVSLQALREHPYPQDFPLRRATLEITAVGVKIDPDGCVAACKPVLDGMVDAGVLRDDSWRTLGSLSIRHEDGPVGLRVSVLFGSAA